MKYWLITFLFFGLSFTGSHDFHVSKCLINYDENEGSIQISMHIFLDDLENVLAKRGGTGLYICTKREAENAEDFIIDYIADQFEIKQNDQQLVPFYLGKEISDDLAAVWCYMEIENVKAQGELEIRNEILLDLFDDQKNITSVKLPGVSEYYLFQKGDSSDKLTF